MSGLRTNLQEFVSQILDTNQDGILDSTEISESQRAVLSSSGNQESLPVTQVVDSLWTDSEQTAESLAREITDLFDNEEGTQMVLSGNSAARITRHLGLSLNECQINPSQFSERVSAYLSGSRRFPRAEYLSDRPVGDPSALPRHFTFSNSDQVSYHHIDINLDFNFTEQVIEGEARYRIAFQAADEIIFDTRLLNISSVQIETAEGLIPTSFRFGEERAGWGRALHVALAPETKSVVIRYSTSTEEHAPGTEWVSPEQTLEGSKPAFYTQGQYYHNRGWLPLHDTPLARKITATTTIHVPEDLGLTVVSTNTRLHHGEAQIPQNGTWTFEVDQPIASYLLAIGIGDFGHARVGDESIVYAEKPLMDKVRADFAPYQEIIDVATGLFGPLPFPVTDTLIMPVSFPWGGMENVGINMNSNTIITGDGSGMDVAVHELMHSWFGNLVTNLRPEDFWLNEGFTMYAERLVFEHYFGEDHYQSSSVLGVRGLQSDLSTPGNTAMSCIATGIRNTDDVDDWFSNVAYEKGYLFAEWLEAKLGQEGMLSFLRAYLQHFSHNSLTTEDFVQFLKSQVNFAESDITDQAIDEWLYGPGLPADAPQFESQNFALASQVASEWLETDQKKFVLPEESENWDAMTWQYFLSELSYGALPKKAMKVLKKRGFDHNPNSATQSRWFALVGQNQFEASYADLEAYIEKPTGRWFHAKPVFAGLIAGGEQELALRIYTENRPRFNQIACSFLDKVVGFEASER